MVTEVEDEGVLEKVLADLGKIDDTLVELPIFALEELSPPIGRGFTIAKADQTIGALVSECQRLKLALHRKKASLQGRLVSDFFEQETLLSEIWAVAEKIYKKVTAESWWGALPATVKEKMVGPRAYTPECLHVNSVGELLVHFRAIKEFLESLTSAYEKSPVPAPDGLRDVIITARQSIVPKRLLVIQKNLETQKLLSTLIIRHGLNLLEQIWGIIREEK